MIKQNINALLCLALLTVGARAQVQVNQRLNLTWFSDNKNGEEGDDQFGLIEERLEVRGNSKNVGAYARVDSIYIHDAPSDNYQDTARLERLLATYHAGDWRIDAGDLHLELGRGIALSLKPVESAGVDTALRGGQISYSDRMLDLGLFAGHANPINFDNLSQKHVEDTPDRIIGARGKIQVRRGLPTLGLFGLYLRPDEQIGEVFDAEEDDRSLTGGITLSAADIFDVADIYLEVDYQKRRLIDLEETGKAYYGTLDLTLGETLVLVEGIYLDEFEQRGSTNSALSNRVDYNRPPTLERIDQEVLDTRDVMGARVRLERPLWSEDYIFHINGMYRLQSPDKEEEIRQLHGYAGVEMYLPDKLTLSGGYRDERYTQSGVVQGEVKLKGMVHFEGDLTIGFEGYELHAQSTNEFRERPQDEGEGMKSYARGSTLLGLERGGMMGLTLEYGYDTEKEGVRQHFVAGIAHWKFMEGQKVRLTAGTQRGGVKCIGGICREYPAFAGGRAEWVARF